MQTIQEFLKVIICGFILLTIILTLALAEADEVTIYDKDWRVQERIQDGKSHDVSRKVAKDAKDEYWVEKL